MPTLRELRGAAGMSQMELANASGVSLETVKKIELGKVERPHPATLRLLAAVLGQVPVVMNGSRGGPVFDRDRVDNARAAGGAGYLRICDDPGVGNRFVPLRRTSISGRISGPLVSLRLTQHFGYTRAECDRVLEAVYRFPLPGDAAVTRVCVRFGEVIVQTRLAERAEAEREYAAAREQGRQAALATRESTDVFTLQLTGLQPDQDVSVETQFVQVAQPEGIGWQLRLPLTIGPRYSRGDEAGTLASRGQPLRVWADPGHRFALDLQVLCVAHIASPSHALRIEDNRVWLDAGEVIPDRDLVLEWQTMSAADRPGFQVLAHEDVAEGMRYFLALITPPTGQLPSLHREVLLLVDRSGSMEGPKWEACRWAVRRFLARMTEHEYFNLGLFQSRCDWLAAAALPVDDANRERALAFLDGHPPTGGTELGVALEQALRSEPAPGERARHVLIVTDAQVSDEGRILQLVESQPEDLRRRVSVICIDSSPRSAFVRALAEAGGGDVAFLSSDPRQEDITTALDRVLDMWARPLAKDAALVAQTGAAGKTTRSRLDLGDLPAGRSVWASGAVSLFAEPTLQLQVGGRVLAEHVMDLEEPADQPEVRSLFGAFQVGRLERLDTAVLDADARNALLDELGYANDALRTGKTRPIYTENARAERSVVHQLLVRESLRYGLVCSATAFVGERIEAGRRVETRVLVPSAAVHGWAMPAALKAPAAPVPSARPRIAHPADSVMRAAPQPPRVSLPSYVGVPDPTDGELVLIEGVLGHETRLSRLHVRVLHAAAVDPRAELCIAVAEAVVVVNVSELVALGGERPLNLVVPGGATVTVLLRGHWPRQAGELRVELS